MSFSFPSDMSLEERMKAVDQQLSHVWMVRTFLKHSEEASEDEELASVHRDLYDYMLALGPSFEAKDFSKYLRIAKKKLGKLRKATELFHEIQPEISGHMNFKMAVLSLQMATSAVEQLLTFDATSIAPTSDTTDDEDIV